jgi:hypothetical protein
MPGLEEAGWAPHDSRERNMDDELVITEDSQYIVAAEVVAQLPTNVGIPQREEHGRRTRHH